MSFERTVNFLYRTFALHSHSIQRVISAIHHTPLFMDGAWLLLLPAKTVLDLQSLQTK